MIYFPDDPAKQQCWDGIADVEVNTRFKYTVESVLVSGMKEWFESKDIVATFSGVKINPITFVPHIYVTIKMQSGIKLALKQWPGLHI